MGFASARSLDRDGVVAQAGTGADSDRHGRCSGTGRGNGIQTERDSLGAPLSASGQSDGGVEAPQGRGGDGRGSGGKLGYGDGGGRGADGEVGGSRGLH